jgi:hypothetical protein
MAHLTEEDRVLSVRVTFYNDGIIADTASNTRDTDLFLQELLAFAAQQFGLERRTDFVHKKQYVSEVMFRPDCDLNTVCDRISKLAGALATTFGGRSSFQWQGFELRPEPPLDSGPVIPFKFEKQLGTPLNENRYYSLAPLSTDEHLRILGQFEQIMLS